MTRLGFIGFGAMARRMAVRLRDAGFEVVAHDPHHTDGEVDGFRMMASAARIAEANEAVLVSVPADEQLKTATEGPGGVLEGAKSGLLLIDLSSVSPAASRALEAAGRTAGIRVVDAPVSGSTPEAEAGELVVLAGGAAEDVEAARPILNAIGKRIVHAGAAGQGSALKLVINGIMGAGMAALAEAAAFGERAGIDRDLLLGILADLAVVSPHHRRKLEAAKSGDFSAQFPTRLMSKDMGLALAETAHLGVPAPVFAAAAQWFALTAATRADEDYSAVVGVLEGIVPKT